MKDLERRTQLLYGVLSSPMGEGDYAEKARRVELRMFVFMHLHFLLLILFTGSLIGSSKSLNHSLNNMCFSNSCRMLIMPKP